MADRHGASEIAATLDVDRQRVTRCARRVAVGPLKAIDDLPRSGRPPDITEAAQTWLIGEACAKPKDCGLPARTLDVVLIGGPARCHGSMPINWQAY